MKIRTLVTIVMAVVCCCFISGCSVRMKVDSFNNPYLGDTVYKRFSFLQTSAGNQPREQQLFSAVRGVMEQRGFVYDDQSPQFQIAVGFGDELKLGSPVDVNEEASDELKRVLIVFVDKVHGPIGKDARILWQGEARSKTVIKTADIEKCMVIGLLNVYPEKLVSETRKVEPELCRIPATSN